MRDVTEPQYQLRHICGLELEIQAIAELSLPLISPHQITRTA